MRTKVGVVTLKRNKEPLKIGDPVGMRFALAGLLSPY